MPTNPYSSIPPGIPPEDYQSFIDAQRKQMLAQMLMQGAQQSAQTPAEWNSMRVVPKRSPLANAATLASALLAGKAMSGSLDSQAGLMGALNKAYAPGGQPVSPGQPLQMATPPADPSEQSVQPLIARQPGASLDQTVAASQPQYSPANPRNPQGLPADVMRTVAMTDPAKYAAMLQGPEAVQLARLSGQDPRAAAAAALDKSTFIDMRPGSTGLLRGEWVTAPDPSKGEQYARLPDGRIVALPIQGSSDVQAERTRASTAAQQSVTPHYETDPFHPGQVIVTYPSASRSAAAPQAPGPTTAPRVAAASVGTAGGLEGQKAGAQEGVKYAQSLTDEAAAALEGKRTLSEMGNLLQNFQPGKFAPVLSSMGAVAQSLGVKPELVERMTSINPGDAEAFQKGTAALAIESVKQISNRATQFEFKQFLQNNPNWMMQPEGIKRVMDFMNKGFDAKIDRQEQFSQWSRAQPADRWSIDFPTFYNRRQLEAIKAGRLNSAPGAQTGIRTRADTTPPPAPTMNDLPPPAQHVGRVIRDTQTGQLLQSDGRNWVPKAAGASGSW